MISARLEKQVQELTAKLAASQALVAKLIAAWPDENNGYGPTVYKNGSDCPYWLETASGFHWPNCKPGPYPTREAAIMAAIGEGGGE
jgi:hypothetical protein